MAETVEQQADEQTELMEQPQTVSQIRDDPQRDQKTRLVVESSP